MRYTIITALTLSLMSSSAFAGGHVYHPAVHIFHKGGAKIIPSVGGAGAGATIVGCGLGVLTAAIIWCGFNQPKRNGWKDTWVDGRSDFYPSYKPRKDGCLFKDKDPQQQVAAYKGK